ncbi:phosphoenolpyruvate hydrolase family protein [Listeria kieliensis]|uniref:AraC family transcriptional regulator n=1 Tax=Listeria kieliensis TaxID=1621700 RepID=A0A3D8TUS1_9LIST|nr:phosphoenolpyruvate hydrolase family protein [Listeria kieliensis]RDX02539.1 AraC family transcriptional regulator [Listeria kieliensis]
MKRNEILKKLRRELRLGHHLLGVATGTGMTASYAEQGGADFTLILNSGRFRQMGRSSLAGFLPFANSNQLVFDFAIREIIPLIHKIPVIFGLNGTDPTINIPQFIQTIKQSGFSGVNNYPSVGLIDGVFREALEAEGNRYDLEVEAIRAAHQADLFTIAFVFNADQVRKMAQAGADVICIHLGLTSGGLLGAQKVLSLEAAIEETKTMLERIPKNRKNVFKMVYGGPVKTLVDIRYLYNHVPELDGYIGGSTFERLPSEEVIVHQTRDFKKSEITSDGSLLAQMLDGIEKHYDYVEFVQKYVEANYSEPIQLAELAQVAHLSPSYLSTLFKEKVGYSFTEYLIRFRLNKAVEWMQQDPKRSLKEIALGINYQDYAQFNKVFKRYMGMSPKEYRQQIT